MQLNWKISREDVARVKALMRQQADNGLVRSRRKKNLAKHKPQVRRKRFWFQMASMRLTSIQRSGPNSHVAKFIGTVPFPLAYDTLNRARQVEALIAKALRKSGGIRFGNKIARELAANFSYLEAGEWAHALKQCNRLLKPVSYAVEQEVASYIRQTFYGFGPKQSRNFLQALGLTRYEVPIDSRVTKWLNEFGFPVRLSATALADVDYYDFVSAGFQALCAKSGEYPCIVDAAIFAMSDGDAWDDETVL